MAIVLIFTACFLLYGNSKHFPAYLNPLRKKLQQRKQLTRLCAYILLIISAFLFANHFGVGTGLTVFLITLLCSLCLTIILLPLNRMYAYLLAGTCLIIIVLENIL